MINNFEYFLKAKKECTKKDKNSWDYLIGGADEEICLKRNRLAFQRWGIAPSALRDVSKIDFSTNFLGMDLHSPIIAAPVGGLTQFHPEGECEWAQGLQLSKTLGVLSGVSRRAPEKVILKTKQPLLYQIYYFGHDDWIEEIVKNVESLGYKGIVVTIDTAYNGLRERDQLNKHVPAALRFEKGFEPPFRERIRSLNLEDIKNLRKMTSLPIILKGVSSFQNVQDSIELGVDAIWISNHGGRQFDYQHSSLEALAQLAPECKKNKLPIIFDGGVRKGGDAIIAKLLGADLVAVGRLPIYGLIVDGATGVSNVFQNLNEELKVNLGLIGCESWDQLSPKCLYDINTPPLETKWLIETVFNINEIGLE